MNGYKKKLLILTPRFPYPVIGGDRLRIYQVCKALSKKFSLTLLSLCETKGEMHIDVPDDGVFDQVERVLLSRSRSYFNTLFSIFSQTPLQVAYYRSSIFDAAVQRLLPAHDGVVSHLIRCAEYTARVNIPHFLEMTDAISLNYERFAKIRSAGGIKGLVYRFETERLYSYERNIIKQFDLSVLVSELDRKYLVDRDNGRVLVCTNGVDLAHLPFRSRINSKPVIVYIGNMTSIQNMDACLYFATEVMPVITRSLDITFRVVGRIGNSDAIRLRSLENIEVTGSVGNVADMVVDARVGVCPVRLAAGVQNKVLEYMALDLPVISSSIGLEGFQAKPDRDLLIADSPEDYEKAIRRLWTDQALANSLAINGRRYVEENHDWNSCLWPMVERISTIIGDDCPVSPLQTVMSQAREIE